MKGKALGFYTISEGDFEFVVTKPLFAVRMLGFWILKVNVDSKGEVHLFLGRQMGVTSGIMPPNSPFWEEADRLLNEEA